MPTLPLMPSETLLRIFLAETPEARDKIYSVRLTAGDEPKKCYSLGFLRLFSHWLSRTGWGPPERATTLRGRVELMLWLDEEEPDA
jgi:hypothetical protein